MSLTKITIFKINLQQGFLLDGDELVAAFNRHTKKIYFRLPYHSKDFRRIPQEFEKFELIDGYTDSFSISMYTDAGLEDI